MAGGSAVDSKQAETDTKRSALAFAQRHWREVNPKHKKAWKTESKTHLPLARNQEDPEADREQRDQFASLFVTHTSLPPAFLTTTHLSMPSQVSQKHVNFRAISSFAYQDKKKKVDKKPNAKDWKTKLKPQTPNQLEKQLAGQQPQFFEKKQEDSSKQVSDFDKQMPNLLDKRFSHPLQPELSGQSHLTRTTPSILVKQPSHRNHLDAIEKTSQENFEIYIASNMCKLTADHCCEIFKDLARKPIEDNGFSVLDPNGNENLPTPFRFAKEFEYLIVNFETQNLIRGKCELLKTNWLKLCEGLIIPSLKELVFRCTSEDADVCLVVLKVACE